MRCSSDATALLIQRTVVFLFFAVALVVLIHQLAGFVNCYCFVLIPARLFIFVAVLITAV